MTLIFASDSKRVLGILLGAGVLFRLMFLHSRQLSTEELQQALLLRSPSIAEMMARFRDTQFHPAPLDYFVQRAMAAVLGEAPWALRLHAVVFGVLSIWIFFRIARLFFGERVAVYAATIFAFYPLTCHYSQQGRPYALFLCLALASYEVLLRKVAGKIPNLQGWLALVLLLTATLYSSLFGVAVLLAQFAGLVVSALWRANMDAPADDGAGIPPARWSHVALYALTATGACALFTPWVQFIWDQPSMTPYSELAPTALVLRIIKELGDGSYPVAALLILGAVTGLRALRRHGRSQPFIWIVAWLATSIPILFLVEILFGRFSGIRHALFLIPPLILLAGYGLSFVGERLTILARIPYRISAPAVVYAVLVILSGLWITQAHGRKEPVDWRGAARFLHENLRSGDVVTMPDTRAFLEYYEPRLASFRVDDLDPGPGLLQSGDVNRRHVACLSERSADPCFFFRSRAAKDNAWRKQEFRGLTVFIRDK